MQCQLSNQCPMLRGGTRRIHDGGGGGGSDVFFWVENLRAWYFLGSRHLSRIFLGLKKIRVFFWVLSLNALFVSGFRCDQWIRKNIHSNFFSATCVFDAGYFFGSKLSGLCIFLGLQYEAPSDPSIMYTSSIPPGAQCLWFKDTLYKMPNSEIVYRSGTLYP